MNKRNYQSNLSTDEKVLMGIVRLAEKFKRVHSAVFRNYGLSFPQYNVLRALEASKGGQNKIGDVSRIMLVPVANITGIAKRLEKDGFIIKKSDPKNPLSDLFLPSFPPIWLSSPFAFLPYCLKGLQT